MKIFQKFNFLAKIQSFRLTRVRMNFCTESSKQQTREKEEYKKFVNFLLERAIYTWDDHHLQAVNTLKELKKFSNYARGDQEKAKEIMKNEKINLFVSALMDSEKQLEEFSKGQLEDIKNITGLKDPEIDSILIHFKYILALSRYYKGIQNFLYKKKTKNEFLPEDQNQLQQFLLLERPEFMSKLNEEKQSKKRKEKKKKLTKTQLKKDSIKEQKDFMKRIRTWQI